MIINDSLEFVFISMPKAGTHSMYAWLYENFRCYLPPTGNYHRRDVPDRAKDYFTFTICRNPYSRAVGSWWFFMFFEECRAMFRSIVKSFDFCTFLRWMVEHQMDIPPNYVAVGATQTQWLHGMRLDAILHLENIQEELDQLPFVTPPAPKMPHVLSNAQIARHGSEYGDWRDFYRMQPEAIELVQEFASDDFDNFGYPREIAL